METTPLLTEEKPSFPIVATCTADGSYRYDRVVCGKPLSEWVNLVHRYMSDKSGWKYFPLSPGAFGYDNLVVSIAELLINISARDNEFSRLLICTSTVDYLAHHVHEGWVKNYTYWRDNSPFLADPSYKKPAKPLGDERRNMCASLKYDDLPQDEKDKDIMVVDCIVNEWREIVIRKVETDIEEMKSRRDGLIMCRVVCAVAPEEIRHSHVFAHTLSLIDAAIPFSEKLIECAKKDISIFKSSSLRDFSVMGRYLSTTMNHLSTAEGLFADHVEKICAMLPQKDGPVN